MRLYIAGPMTGLPEFNYPAFFVAAERLRRGAYETLNPARRGLIEGATWVDYMRAALVDVAAADGVALLDGWEASKGARLEVHVAQSLDLPIRSVGAWLREVAA